MKNNLSYYSHDINSHTHWKFKTLRRSYGWAGEGKFWALNNLIAAAQNCALDISQPTKKAAIAAEIDYSPEEFDAFVEYLVVNCHLLKRCEGRLCTGVTQENLTEVNNKRERNRKHYQQSKEGKPDVRNTKPDGKNENRTSETQVSATRNIQRKESKVKERKESKEEDTAPELPSGLPERLEGSGSTPTWQAVLEAFSRAGGTDDQARKFFDKHEALGWQLGEGKPIKRFAALIPKFLRNWQENDMRDRMGKNTPAKPMTWQEKQNLAFR